MTYNDANDFLMQGGTPAAKFPSIGSTIIGMIVKPPKVREVTDPATGEVKRWPSGDAQMQVVIELQTELRDPTLSNDDGIRTLWCKGLMQNAVRDAVRRSGAPGLEVEGILQVTYSANGEQKNKAFNPPKIYTATYTPPQARPVAIPDGPGGYEQPAQQAMGQHQRGANHEGAHVSQQAPAQTQVAARPVTQQPDPAVAQSFMERLRQQAANNQAARAQTNHHGLPQDEEPPY